MYDSCSSFELNLLNDFSIRTSSNKFSGITYCALNFAYKSPRGFLAVSWSARIIISVFKIPLNILPQFSESFNRNLIYLTPFFSTTITLFTKLNSGMSSSCRSYSSKKWSPVPIYGNTLLKRSITFPTL